MVEQHADAREKARQVRVGQRIAATVAHALDKLEQPDACVDCQHVSLELVQRDGPLTKHIRVGGVEVSAAPPNLCAPM